MLALTLAAPCLADGGDASDKLRKALTSAGDWTIEIIKRSDQGLQSSTPPLGRRTDIRLAGRCRRLAKDWEATVASSAVSTRGRNKE